MIRKCLLKKKLMSFGASLIALGILTSCGNAYNDYASAYNKVTANGGMEAKFDVELSMDGEKVESEGNFKLDTSGENSILYYEMKTDGNDIVQFSDGEYIYTDMGDKKSKYKLGTKPSGGNSEVDQKKESQNTFNTSEFLSQFSSFLEAGKIKELGLLTPIEKAATTKTTKSGSTYNLEFSKKLLEKYLNTMVQNETGKDADETIQIENLRDFKYSAKEENGMISEVTYEGVMDVSVPASLMADGEAKTYDLDMKIEIEFENPGEKVTVELPSTDGFEEVK